jgi:hypothetical protein
MDLFPKIVVENKIHKTMLTNKFWHSSILRKSKVPALKKTSKFAKYYNLNIM